MDNHGGHTNDFPKCYNNGDTSINLRVVVSKINGRTVCVMLTI